MCEERAGLKHKLDLIAVIDLPKPISQPICEYRSEGNQFKVH